LCGILTGRKDGKKFFNEQMKRRTKNTACHNHKQRVHNVFRKTPTTHKKKGAKKLNRGNFLLGFLQKETDKKQDKEGLNREKRIKV